MSAMVQAAQPAAARPGTPRPGFGRAVRGELLKLRGQRSSWAMLGVAVLLLAALMADLATASGMRTELRQQHVQFFFDLLDVLQFVLTSGAGIFLLVLSAPLVGMEYSGGTLRVLLAGGLGRLQLLGAKLLALALAGLLVLAGYVALCAAGVLAVVVMGWTGSVASLGPLPAAAWHDLGWSVLAATISMGVCILLGAAAATVGRSLAFGLAAALAFFPADNFGALLLGLAGRITGQGLWARATAYLLGPNLNQLPVALQTGHAAHGALVKPAVPVDRAHVLVAIAIYALAVGLLAAVLTWRRDVRE